MNNWNRVSKVQRQTSSLASLSTIVDRLKNAEAEVERLSSIKVLEQQALIESLQNENKRLQEGLYTAVQWLRDICDIADRHPNSQSMLVYVSMYANNSAAAIQKVLENKDAMLYTREYTSIFEWKPISTAPTDNKRPLLLAYFNDQGTLLDIDFNGELASETESWGRPNIIRYWMGTTGNVDAPTHWAYQPEGFTQYKKD